MSEKETQFRGAAFGGFNRQDVLDYITRMTQENRAREDDLKAKADRAQEELFQLQREERGRRAQAEEQRAQITQLEEQLARQEKELTRVQEELTVAQHAQQGDLTQLREENDRLRAKLEALEPDAQAYEQLRTQMADIELEARGRSQAILRRVDEDVAQRCKRAEQVLRKTEHNYDETRLLLETTMSHIVGELHRVEEQLTNLSGAMDAGQAELASLTTVEVDDHE